MVDLSLLIMPHVKGGNDEWKREGEAAVAFLELQPETSRCQRSELLGQVVSTSRQKSFFFWQKSSKNFQTPLFTGLHKGIVL